MAINHFATETSLMIIARLSSFTRNCIK